MEPEAEVKLYIKYQRDVVAPLVAERRRLLLQYVFNVDGAATEKARRASSVCVVEHRMSAEPEVLHGSVPARRDTSECVSRMT